jgi:uncharacterized membrane protein YqhA
VEQPVRYSDGHVG